MPALRLAILLAIVLSGGCLPLSVACAQTEPPRFEQPATAARIPRETQSAPNTADPHTLAPPVANAAGEAQPAGYLPLPNRAEAKSSVAGKPIKSLALAPRAESKAGEATTPARSGPSFISLIGGLAMVLGLFLMFAWIMKRGMPKGAAVLPSEVIEVLGRAPLAPRQQMHLLRVGNKLLLVCVSAAGTETLTEVTDPVEVDRLAGLCQQTRPHSATNAFKQAFQQFAPRRKAGPAEDSEGADG